MWYLFQIGVYCLVAWSDIRFHWSGWKHGDPIWPILLMELAAMWAATVAVSVVIDLIARWRYRQRHIGRGPLMLEDCKRRGLLTPEGRLLPKPTRGGRQARTS
jgi:hypothetical protein